MNTTFELGNLKVIDLTKPLDPKTESRRCHLIRYNTGGPIPDFHTAMDLTTVREYIQTLSIMKLLSIIHTQSILFILM